MDSMYFDERGFISRMQPHVHVSSPHWTAHCAAVAQDCEPSG